MSEWLCKIKVNRYPFDSQGSPAYETCFDAFDMLLSRVAAADDFVKEKLMERPEVAKIIREVDETNKKRWVSTNVELYDVEVYLTKNEWRKLVTETINALKARTSLLEEHLKNLGAEEIMKTNLVKMKVGSKGS